MYNKRVRIATEMFSELFGPDFDSIIPIYPTGGPPPPPLAPRQLPCRRRSGTLCPRMWLMAGSS